MHENPGALLIVDDDDATRATLRFYLESKGFEIADAADAVQALDWLQQHPCDLVLLDVVMPDRSGLDVLGEIRRSRPLADLPVIMATARDQGKDVVAALERGANDYVTKPFDFPVVLARVQTQLALQRCHAQLRHANRRMRAELEAASKVQAALLPEVPRVEGAHFAWRYQPCAQLAGDLLNITVLGHRHVVLCVLDVVGHGVKAALLAVMVSRALARLIGPTGVPTPPAIVAAQLNDEFRWDDRTEQYFTLLYGVLDVSSGRFRYVCAGHPGPLHVPRHADAQVFSFPGSVIGLGDGPYEEHTLTLEPGDRLYLYSDGLPDAMNTARKKFGEARLCQALVHTRAAPLRQGLDELVGAVEAWCGPAPPHDDISILAVERA